MSTSDDSVLECYNEGWIAAYDGAAGLDQELKDEEMQAFDQLVSTFLKERGVSERHLALLDVGTCAGRYLAWALERGFGRIEGIDRSPAAARHCERRFGDRITVHLGDVQQFDGSAGSYDLVTIMFGTINHFSRAEIGRMLRAMRHWLTDQGGIVVSSWRPGGRSLSLYDGTARHLLGARSLDLGELRSIALEAGLRASDRRATSGHWVVLMRPEPRPARSSKPIEERGAERVP